MEIMGSDTRWDEHAFYFGGHLDASVVAKLWRFRSEREYDSEERPELTAMTHIESSIGCIGKQSFLLLASDVAARTAVRSRKGILWENEALRELPHITFETECDNGQTRLGALVDLSKFRFDSSANMLLNWGHGLLVLTASSLEEVEQLARQWVSTNARDVIAINYDAVATTLRQNAGCGILRYFPPSPSRPETVAVIAGNTFVSDAAFKCIDSLM